ncbi:S9 family peptidase [Pseudoalteromonas aurantia]|uniref:S9 family peptidase n=1 Tax=Pseudoalteromonas aurantia TaxID=43654 RepID=A0A5S3VEX5_9GAMM|nr:prolyl oligopeptidase family serine peptidase [Pseudoalteromonas aurantia]TMO60300.1 S9 family peptidase [Pseudoalteromonas aurantia]TMO70600.1 S9 family peptidase [Pseudoalteromonas aurantia]TMO74893.1 S9 family peptidase [Pseudoalteromonas aurantia]
MIKQSLISAAIASSLFLTGCQTTHTSSNQIKDQGIPASVVATPVDFGGEQITLEQAMAHPDWLGRKPQNAFWAADSKTVVFNQKQAGSDLKDTFIVANNTAPTKVLLSQLHSVGAKNAVYSSNGEYQVYTFKGNVFAKTISTGDIKQLTFSSERAFQLQFLNSGDVAYRVGNTFYTVNVRTGQSKELTKLHLSDAPKGLAAPNGFIAEEQHKLIEYVALTHKNSLDREQRTKALKEQNSTVANSHFYLGKGKALVSASLSPAGDKLIAVVTDKTRWNAETDIMPNYVSQNGDIDPVQARRRVAQAKAVYSEVVLLELATKAQTSLSYDTLPGYDEDVLAGVKKENAAAIGKTYQSEKSPRAINLIRDWGWSQSAIQWNSTGSEVAVMLEAWDNKDRWLATVDFEQQEFVSQHRLHDEAWVNYVYNDFGWLNNTDTLYYLSEESGYSHIYTKPLGGRATQLTSGNYVVSNLTLSKDDSAIYYKANVEHPGLYEIYRVDPQTAKTETLTDLNGMTDYSLSPDGTKLLLNHSKIMMPNELYVADAKPGATTTRLTNTVSDTFLNKKLIAPKIVAVPSSHTDQPVYAKVYYPADYVEGEGGKKRKAVIFNHGAGYLQNSHMGWSVYFREFMFHSLLASEGYVVMDMDYRASKGYGRDWRTAIYRQMGKPEVEDLADGVKWMAEYANVDTKSVGTYGGSYGGFMTFMAMFTQPDLFQAGAALRPVTDWAYYNTGYTSNILNHPDVDPIAYRRSSPIYHAQGLKNDLLINAPMIDDNVFFQDVVRLVQRLIELEKEDFETAIYPVEPHGFVQPSSWLDEYRRIYKLFQENL